MISHPTRLTNGEVLEALPMPQRRLLAPAMRVHDLCCYGEQQAGPAEHALLEELQRRVEKQP